jgi:serine/threonine protein kinase
MPFERGRTVGHYVIQELLGAGGMGEVYAAEDTRLKRRVALKVLPDSVANDEARRVRFEREAQSVAALNHPSIVTLHSVEHDAGTVFLTMELVEGRPLTELITRGRWRWRRSSPSRFLWRTPSLRHINEASRTVISSRPTSW